MSSSIPWILQVFIFFLPKKFSGLLSQSGFPHTGEYLVQVVEEAIGRVQTETKAIVAGLLFPFFCEISVVFSAGVVTDNAANMAYMRSKIGDSDIFRWGCQAHVLQLLSKTQDPPGSFSMIPLWGGGQSLVSWIRHLARQGPGLHPWPHCKCLVQIPQCPRVVRGP